MPRCSDFEVTVLDAGGDRAETTVHALRGDGAIVLDLWSTTCTRCPAALEKLHDFAKAQPADVGVIFASLNCDDADLAEELTDESEWTSMTHLFMETSQKDIAKAELGLKAFPFVIAVDKNGDVAYAGPAKGADYAALAPKLLQGNAAAVTDENAAPNAAPAAAGGDAVATKQAEGTAALDDFALDEDF
uniref:Thioredoxin domain-containing protein n=1 Tax=Phaeomonas parva TaxID=124430 RepID=A0A7S1U7Z3_9STRA